MKVLIFGDVYGRIGRKALKKEIPKLVKLHNPDFIIANVDNCTSGRGPIEKHIKELELLGIDLMTGGDHVFDNIDRIKDYIETKDSKLIRPANFYESDNYKTVGKGYKIIKKNNKTLLVIHVLSETFMNHKVENPFLKVKKIIKENKIEKLDGIIIDFHKEVTSEGYGMAYMFDGIASFIFGTHTHIQTNDELILAKGTGIISDVGMNGALYSIIGADYKSVEKRFLTGISKGKITQCLDENYIVNGVIIEIGKNKECKSIEKIRIRGKL